MNPTIGALVSGRCVTNFTNHSGAVVSSVPATFYSDGTVTGWTVTIFDRELSRNVILWPGTASLGGGK